MLNKEYLIIGIITLIAFFSIYKSVLILRKKTEILSYYPFDVILPGSLIGTVFFYFIFIAALFVSLYFLMLQANIFLPPA
jgi:uncharacterized membrane protein